MTHSVPIIWQPFASPWSGELMLRTQRSGNVFKEKQLRAENEAKFWSDEYFRCCCVSVRDEGNQKTPTPFAPLSLGCRELRRSSQTSAAHLLFIRQPLPPPRLGQLRPGSCARCLTHLTLRWSALMSLSTPRSLEPSLNGAEGDYVTPCLWGRSVF